jgi:acetoin utilization deacetylase AcuC-like enzyme
MATLLITHDMCLEHETPHGHPERADRLRAIREYLSAGAFETLIREEAPLAPLEEAANVHPLVYLEELAAHLPHEGVTYLDGDTVLSPHSLTAALYGVGAVQAAIDAVFSRRVSNAFCAIRPPGHHAETAHAMGFCLINNVAVGARYAQAKYGIKRVAIVDWDVHHGNGTQEIFWSDPDVMYASTHEMPLFPGTGAAGEMGAHQQIVNVPLDPDSSPEDFRHAFTDVILPRLEEFKPDLILISSGFDAHILDPLGSLQLTEDDFAWATRELMRIADTYAQGRIVSVLEGGYDLVGLGSSVSAHVRELMQASSTL